MASFSDRIARALRSPQARRLADKATEVARDPATRRRIEELRTRLTGKRRPPGDGTH